jgi:hypothetical protein
MKHINEYIDESLDNSIFEGFLDKLKDAIENVVDNPKKYFKIINDKLQVLKDKEDYDYFKKKDPEEVSKELDNLNNDKDLKDIYLYTKKDYKNLSYYDKNKYNYIDFIKNIKEYFNCDENKAYAIMQIALVIADEIKKEKQKKTSKQSYSTNSNDVTMYSTIGAAIGLMDN